MFKISLQYAASNQFLSSIQNAPATDKIELYDYLKLQKKCLNEENKQKMGMQDEATNQQEELMLKKITEERKEVV